MSEVDMCEWTQDLQQSLNQQSVTIAQLRYLQYQFLYAQHDQ
jgi:hypothetical protein